MALRVGVGQAWWLAMLAACTASGRAGAGEVRGTVVDRDGRPAAGALVRVARLAGRGPIEAVEATADGSGAFGVAVGEGAWGVFACRGDEGSGLSQSSFAQVAAGKGPAPLTIRLGSPTRLHGRLLDAETGAPAPGGSFVLDDARRVAVDADGRFEAPGLAAGHHEAYPLCPGYERRRILFDTTGRPDAELELRLPRAGKVVGRVVGPDGRPIPGAVVGRRTSGSIFSGTALWERCDADGRYSYDGNALGQAGRLLATAPGFLEQERQDIVAPDPAAPATFDFALRPAPPGGRATRADAAAAARRTVAGTVTGPGGKPVASAVVRWGMRVSSDAVPEVKTDAEGKFRLESVPDAPEALSVMAQGLAPAFPMVDAGGDRQVAVALEAGATIRGRVVDDGGAPIAGATVHPVVNNPKPNWGGFVYLDEQEATADRDGRFTLEGMPAGVTCDVLAERHSAERRRPLDPADESRNVFTLAGEGALRGRVVTADGRPARNFRIQVNQPKDRKPGDKSGSYFAGYTGIGLSFTRDDGEFTITGLTAGSVVRLTALAGSLGTGELDRAEVATLGHLNPADAATIRLAPPHALRVRVFGRDGKVVEGAPVTIIQSEGRGGHQWGPGGWEDSSTARTDPQGWAEFAALGFGKGTVIVRPKGLSRHMLQWAKDEAELEVFVEPEATIAGTVLDVAGRPAGGAQLFLSFGSGESLAAATGPDGRYRVDGLAPGHYNLCIVDDRGDPRLTPEQFDLEPGQAVTCDIRLPAPGPAKPDVGAAKLIEKP